MYSDKPVTTTAELAAAIAAGDYPVISDDGRYEAPADAKRHYTIKVTGTAKPTIITSDTSSPSVVANGTSSPSVEAYDTSSPRVEAYDTSSPSVVAYDTSSPSVEAYDTSSPSVVAYVTSSPSVVAYGTSSPRVVAYDTSSPSVVANGYSSVVARGRVTITADATATVRAAGGQPTVTGGALVQRVPLTTEPATVRAMLRRIEANPQEWYQGTWAIRTDCGTAFCAAGHGLLEVGARIDIDNESVEVASLPEKFRRRFVREHVPISQGAQVVLGLDTATANRLFNGGNDMDTLRELVDEICAGAEPAAADTVAAATE
jgi:hypothetical protein